MGFKLLNNLPKKHSPPAPNASEKSYLLILEDDPDQMEMLVSFAMQEMHKLFQNDDLNQKYKEKIVNMSVISVTSIESLKNQVTQNKNILFALLDCNTPDSKGDKPHDQFVKKGYQITGQHKAVDLVMTHLPNTPITMISSFNRFQKIVLNHYDKTHNLTMNFIKKKDHLMIKNNINYYLRQHLNQ